MNIDKFQEFVEKFQQHQKDVLVKKGSDYSSNDDVLSNFKKAGNAIKLSPDKQILALISTKIVRIGNLLDSNMLPNNESVADSVTDMANYTLLLAAFLQEQLEIEKLS